MMEQKQPERVCPLCAQKYTQPPALSRTDNETLICPDCGTRQALEGFGITRQGQDYILSLIHRRRGG